MTKKVKGKLLKLILTTMVICAVALIAYFVLKSLGLLDIEKLRDFINTGIWGVIIYILIQVFQVVFIPVNTSMFTIPAVILFGPVKGFLVCWIGCALGSIVLFFVVRGMGVKALKWIVGEDDAKKFQSILGKGKYILPILLLIPIFPDDILCASAGLSDIKPLYYIIVVIITRAIDAASTAFIGSALVKSAAGIVFLCIYVVFMLVLSLIVAKNHEKMEEWINKRIKKLKKNRK